MSDVTPPPAPEASPYVPAAAAPAAPAYAAPVPTPPSAAKGLAIAALITGLASLLTMLFIWLSVACGIAAITLGIIALVKRQSKGMSITGIITGGVGILGSIVVLIVASFLLAGLSSAIEGSGQSIIEQIEGESAPAEDEALSEASPEVRAAAEAFVPQLRAAVPSAEEVLFDVFGTTGSIAVFVADETSSVPGYEYRTLLQVAAQFSKLPAVDEWMIEGYTLGGEYPDLSAAALEAGVPAEFIDSYGDVYISSDDLVRLFG